MLTVAGKHGVPVKVNADSGRNRGWLLPPWTTNELRAARAAAEQAEEDKKSLGGNGRQGRTATYRRRPQGRQKGLRPPIGSFALR